MGLIMKRVLIYLALVCCLSIPLVFGAEAANLPSHVHSSMVVHLDGGVVEKVQLQFRFHDEKNYSPFVFLVPFNAGRDIAEYDKRMMLYDCKYFDGYSICSITPLIQSSVFEIHYTNENGAVFSGISLRGTIDNGLSELRLTIPYVEEISVPKGNYNYFINEFDEYSATNTQAITKIVFDKQNQKGYFPEDKDAIVQLQHAQGKDVIFEYTLNLYYKEKESSMMTVMTVVILPTIWALLLMIIPVEDKTNISKRWRWIYGITAISPVIVFPLCIAFKMPAWVYIVLAVAYALLYIFIYVNCSYYIKAFFVKMKTKLGQNHAGTP